jgi:hypothetical protein
VPAQGVFAPGSNQRDSEAAGWHTTAHCLTLIPRRRVPLAGSVGAKRIKVGGTTERTMCVVCRTGSSPSCQFRRIADDAFLTLRWWRETAGCAMKGQKGNRDRRPCSPTAECQTNLVLPVRSAIFPSGETKCSGRKMAVLTVISGVLAGRSLAALLLGLRRQAEPRAVILCLARAKHRGLLLSGRT